MMMMVFSFDSTRILEVNIHRCYFVMQDHIAPDSASNLSSTSHAASWVIYLCLKVLDMACQARSG